ncbi:MAG: hypothetical protein JSW54_06835 [Fidelibacterota bacterium]|nr:MAG: hypothetical protein JSW54_06835 [Candidatus Neomarinimicrobiota bacterium]
MQTDGHMNLGILTREEPVYSLLIYRENLKQQLSALDLDITTISDEDPDFEKVDLVWDPGLLSVRFPHPAFRYCRPPVVGTIHGLAGHTLSIREYFPDPVEAVIGQAFHEQVAKEWKWFRNRLAMLIAVSKYGAQEVVSVYKVPR